METTWFKFEDLPAGLKAIAKVREIAWKPKVGDKGLATLLKSYLGKDNMRPVMSLMNADEHGFTVTNAHILMHIPATVPAKERGTYDLQWKPVKEFVSTQRDKFGQVYESREPAKFPNYMAVVPKDNPRKYTIDLLRLDSYLTAADHYTNKVTHMVVLTASDEERFMLGVNGIFMRDVIRTMRELGHEHADLHCSEPNRAMIFTPVGKRPLKDVSILLMPVMIEDQQWVEDPDFDLGLASRYDLRTNTLENRDGTITDTWTVQEGWQPSGNVTKERLALIRHVTSSNKAPGRDYIWEYASVKNGTLTCSDGETLYTLQDCGLADGWYAPVSEGMVPSVFYDSQNAQPHRAMFPADVRASLKWPVEELRSRLEIAMVLTSGDQIRPEFNHPNIIVKDGTLTFVTTDHFGMYLDQCKVPSWTPDFQVQPMDNKAQLLLTKVHETGTVDMQIDMRTASISNITSTATMLLSIGPDTLRVAHLERNDNKGRLSIDNFKASGHASDRAIILNKKEVDELEKLTKPGHSILLADDDSSAAIFERGEVKQKVDLRTAKIPQPRKKLMIQMPARVDDNYEQKGYGAFGLPSGLFKALKSMYVGRASSEFTLHHDFSAPADSSRIPVIIVSNPTLPDWPDDHVLGSKQGGRPVVTVTPGPAKPRKEPKQLEIEKLKEKRTKLESELFAAKEKDNQRLNRTMGWGAGMRMSRLPSPDTAEKKVRERIEKIDKRIAEISKVNTPDPVAIRARAAATALRLKLKLMQMKY